MPVDPLTMEAAVARIESFIAAGGPHHVFTADASGIMRTWEDPELRDIVRQADLVTPDGAGVMLATELQGRRLPERVSGCDLVDRLAERSAERGYRLYLFGAADGVADAAAAALVEKYPGVHIAGTRHGYFTDDEELKIVQAINRAKPDILFVALGIPKQEQFIRKYFALLRAPVMIGVGGSFDVISGQLKRAPEWMRKSGLEWLFRLIQQPERLPRFAALPRFVWTVLRHQKR
ncbi:MAG TPA: WecB/TagA/CpsF family glycosyltransferase [Armatimonadota bacterium]|nr:WecB/TagA/CpsF family glycosyltransferase [Armatimonadota bacterium]